MRKHVTLLVGICFLVGAALPGAVLAQTTVEDNIKKVQDLNNQIRTLQEQIRTLQQQQIALQASSTQAIIEIAASLKQGSQGDQVKVLQTLLALDASIYPEGLVSGYFGPATRRALERYQRANGLSAVGFVGPRTRELLNKLIREQFKVVENLGDLDDDDNDDDDDDAEDIRRAISAITLPPLPSDTCGVPVLSGSSTIPMIVRDGKVKLVQTGNVFIYKDGKHKVVITPNTYIEKDGKKHLVITPGMRIEKDGKFKVIVPCNGTTTPPTAPDTTAPSMTAVTVSSTTHQGANISWSTNESATGKIYYGTTTPVNLATSQTASNSSLTTAHSFNISGLSATTTYYFLLVSKDAAGNTATSSQHSFVTAALPDTTAPIISSITTTPASTTAQISWTTNEPATRKVYYATSTPISLATALSVFNNTLATSHSLTLSPLTASTTYYFVLESKDAVGNTATTTETSFVTQ